VHANPGEFRPAAVLQCGAVRLRPLTEAECYARCYGGLRSDQVSVIRYALPKHERPETSPPSEPSRQEAVA